MPVPYQYLHPVAPLVHENKQVPAGRRLPHERDYFSGKPVICLAHIRRTGAEINRHADRCYWDHAALPHSRMMRMTSLVSVVTGKINFRPSGKCSSIPPTFATDRSCVIGMNSGKVFPAVESGESVCPSRSFLNHQASVDNAILFRWQNALRVIPLARNDSTSACRLRIRF